MSLILHEDHIRLREEIEKRKQSRTDILARYAPDDLVDIKKVDLYFLLDVPGYRFKEIPETFLFKKYRERIVKYHPDRQDDRVFMALRDAYGIIKDPFWKKKYDWYFLETEEIDDKVYNEEIFYETFEPFFEKVSIFSKHQDIPSLGDKNTSKTDIKNFYSFWRNFESTRSFEFLSYKENHAAMSEWALAEHEQKLKKQKKDLFNTHVLNIRRVAKICEKNDPRFEREVILVSPKLTVNGWTENDIIQFERLKKKCKTGNQIDWKKFIKEFKAENGQKRNMRDFLIKNTQIEKFKEECKENTKQAA